MTDAPMAKAEAERVWPGGGACGGVRYEITVQPAGTLLPLRPVPALPWPFRRLRDRSQCTVKIEAQGMLSWYRSSAMAQRGFCSRCGSSLPEAWTGRPA